MNISLNHHKYKTLPRFKMS